MSRFAPLIKELIGLLANKRPRLRRVVAKFGAIEDFREARAIIDERAVELVAAEPDGMVNIGMTVGQLRALDGYLDLTRRPKAELRAILRGPAKN